MSNKRTALFARRKKRVSTNIVGTSSRPRVALHRSNKFLYAQAVDDIARRTLAAISTMDEEKKPNTKKAEASARAGETFGVKLKALKIEKVVVDRSRFRYHGRVRAFVEGLRKSGIIV
jgi:large subunit ribosomal protein L18